MLSVRPYLSGSLHNPQLPELIYEDCFGGAAQHFAGGSAAQSTLIQVRCCTDSHA